ncbi:hypothetical protein ABTZ03_28580 [Kitasatospora sp. NPDC096077]|uniref:hypothetical protein n=1 Tax=Kitasatospora sp. NPDC096077 TaxID=3155544 RepID=UPI0033266E95
MTDRKAGVGLYTSWRPALRGAEYTVSATHTVTRAGENSPLWTFRSPDQTLVTGTPRFSVSGADVCGCFPPPGGSGEYGYLLPFVSFGDPYLPWEHELLPGGHTDPTWAEWPWMALLVIAEDELDAGDVHTGKAVDLLKSSSDTRVPDLDLGDGSAQTSCTVIDLPADLYRDLLPAPEELHLWAHVREPREKSTGQDDGTQDAVHAPPATATLVAARFPRTPGRHTAHVVSLAGHEGTLTSPPPAGSTVKVRMVSLFSWTFTTLDPAEVKGRDDDRAITALREDLQRKDGSHGRLRVPGPENPADPVEARLYAGYSPVRHRLVTGEQTLAWYRGPFVPGPTEPAPEHTPYACADEALIYVKGDGVFDVSLAAAFNLGAQLVMCRNDLFDTMLTWRHTAGALARAAALATHPQSVARPLNPLGTRSGGPVPPPRAEGISRLTAPQRLRTAFDAAMVDGLGVRLTDRLHATPVAGTGARPEPTGGSTASVPKHLATLLADPGWREPLRQALSADLAAAASAHPGAAGGGPAGSQTWQWDPAAMLALVPTWYLLPLPDAVLPPDSARFFHIDGHWLNAFADGMLSVGAHTHADTQLTDLLKKVVFSSGDGPGIPGCGLLLRSPLVRSWPPAPAPHSTAPPTSATPTGPGPGKQLGLTVEGAALTSWRLLSAETLLLLFDRTPTVVHLRQPAHVLELGLDSAEGGLTLRNADGGVPANPTTLKVFGTDKYVRPSTSTRRRGQVLEPGPLLDDICAHLGTGTARNSETLAFQLLHVPVQLDITPGEAR